MRKWHTKLFAVCMKNIASMIEGMLKKFVKHYSGVDIGEANQNVFSSEGSAFDKFLSGIGNWWKGFTGSGLTQRDIELNNLSMQNVEEQASHEVAGYNKAGINPALMYSGGVGTAPQASASGSVGNMSELVQLLSLPYQLKMLKAQTENVQANTEKTRKDTEKVGYDIDELKEKIKGLGISNEQQSIVLKYLDRVQQAELRIKDLSAERIDADIDSIYHSISNMDAQTCAVFVEMCETMEHIASLQSQQSLNDEQGKYYSKLVSNLDKQNKILDLQERDWDYINVLGTTSFSTGIGPFKGSESHVVTLHDLKTRAEKAGEEKAKQEKNNGKSWNEIRRNASERYGALE